MCLICIDLAREKLTAAEAFRNLREMWEEMDEEHLMKLAHKIYDLEQEERIEKRKNEENS
tara:strand:+ start:233 stop:412 length:180 start_codon:yes stop_codon:yes gene_type:complete